MNLPRHIKKDDCNQEDEQSGNETKRFKRHDRIALIICAFLVLILVGIIKYQFEVFLFYSIIGLFLIILFCPECIAMIVTLFGTVVDFICKDDDETEKEDNNKMSFVVVIGLVIAIIALSATLAFLGQPESSASTDPDTKIETIGSRASGMISAIATELKRTIREQNSGEGHTSFD